MGRNFTDWERCLGEELSGKGESQLLAISPGCRPDLRFEQVGEPRDRKSTARREAPHVHRFRGVGGEVAEGRLQTRVDARHGISRDNTMSPEKCRFERVHGEIVRVFAAEFLRD